MPHETWNAPYRREVCDQEFPFVTSCLVHGAAVDLKRGDCSNISPLDWSTPFDGGDNNDGVTIIDFTDPHHVRFCFAVFDGFEQLNDEDSDTDGLAESERKMLVPLTAAEYLDFYKPGGLTGELKKLVEQMNEVLLIDSDALEDAWPRGWSSRVQAGLPGVPTQPSAINAGAPSLTDIAMEKTFEKLLEEEHSLREKVEELPSYLPNLRTFLAKHPDVVNSRVYGFDMLQFAMEDQEDLDLYPFTSLRGEQVLKLVEAAAESMTALDLSGVQAISTNDVKKILERKHVTKLTLWSNEAVDVKKLQHFVSGGTVKEIIHREQFLAAFQSQSQENDVYKKYTLATTRFSVFLGFYSTLVLSLRALLTVFSS
ncbi:hypothetical protein EJ04DRAFT_6788 [Polyplosphaeria fusca]|uniref:Uncharacterized protein n=1 Tax=Polyplosphaeria fusca TaxID=682080 RepID=A0A9P4R3Z8_9PLEO|nr:hypothetical protein EJ04DRAFT_6788 [Polyplosphaeria fusca]